MTMVLFDNIFVAFLVWLCCSHLLGASATDNLVPIFEFKINVSDNVLEDLQLRLDRYPFFFRSLE